ncbi:MAG: TonB-dependent receptor [Ignavibacteriae bacterium]|nr:TonB-dependent receptor [Ignavibacteriota bacterium]NOG99675.1 TonB-dependent receptor [Ignavibacteriota bacterium]
MKMKKLASYLILLITICTGSSRANQISVIGFVKDAKTNERLIGAVILNGGIGLAVSDSSGYFSFKLNPGKYFLECKYIGYETAIKEINLEETDEEFEIFYFLKPQPIEIEKVTVSGVRYKELEDFKTYELQSGDLSNIPVFLESDVLRAFQALPGITSVHDLSAQIYLRGGNYDETLITLDGVPIYNPYHLGGIFGSVNPEIVDKAVIYPSNYPVNYDGVLSGVLNLNSKTGNSEKIKGTGSIGLVSSKLYLNGPLLNGNFIFSARRTYPDLLFNLLSKSGELFPYYFYDFYSKYTIPVDSKNLFSLSAFYSKDIYRVFEDVKNSVVDKKENPNWGNLIGNLKFNHLFNSGEFELGAYYSISNLDSDAKSSPLSSPLFSSAADSLEAVHYVYANNSIKEFNLNSQFKLKLTGQDILLGVEYKNLSISYFWNIKEYDIGASINGNVEDIFFDFAPAKFKYNDETEIVSAYFSDKIQITKVFDVMLGYRGMYIKNVKKYLNSPYAKIRYKLNNNLELSSSYGKYHQYFFTKRELINQSYYYPFSIYFIADNSKNIPSSDHYSLGIQIKEIIPGIALEVEGYYKTRNNIYTSDELTKTYSYTKGYTAGVDALLKKEMGAVTGWASYTFSRTVKNDSSNKYFANYDRTHNFKLMLNYNLSEKWKLNALWLYSTGLPFTPAIGKYIKHEYYRDGGGEKLEHAFGRKNSSRYQDYHRLDVGITGNFIWWDSIIAKPYLQIMNVYMSKNPFNYDPNPNDVSLEDGQEVGSMIIPTIGITLEF